MKKQKEPTLRDVMTLLKEQSTVLEEHGQTWKGIAATLKEHDELFAFIIEHMATKEDLAIEIGKSESRMLDAMDRMVGDVRGDLVATTRKVDEKDSALIRTLDQKRVVTKREAKQMLSMSLFPHVAR